MALSVPREVLQRAVSNLPLSQQPPPKFGSFGWRMASVQSSSTPTVLEPEPEPIPPEPPAPEPSYQFHIVRNDNSSLVIPNRIIGQRFYVYSTRGASWPGWLWRSEDNFWEYSFIRGGVWFVNTVSGFGADGFNWQVFGSGDNVVDGIGALKQSGGNGSNTTGTIYLTTINYQVSSFSSNTVVNGKRFYNAGPALGNTRPIYYSSDKVFILSASSTNWYLSYLSGGPHFYRWTAGNTYPSGTSTDAGGGWTGSVLMRSLCG